MVWDAGVAELSLVRPKHTVYLVWGTEPKEKLWVSEYAETQGMLSAELQTSFIPPPHLVAGERGLVRTGSGISGEHPHILQPQDRMTRGAQDTISGGMDSDSGEQSEGEPGTAAGPDVFSSKNLALQAQKKILSKIASKTVANMLIDDTSSEIFDELYKVTKEHIHNKKEAHKIMKDLIKVAIKIGILYRNNQFSPEEVVIVEKFRKKLNQTAMTIVSFYEVEYTFDRNVLSKLLHECKDLVHELVQRHLTPRTHGRINHVFNHFANVEFLSTLYSLDGDCRPNLKKICEGINKLIDEKVL
ncbi:unnamed protein product [Rangifer tarandus platyrhynchus]|uniref:Uncharacterized protein n=4 Tax=Odocoileinae TaxID=9881 RepID=A0ACB0FBK5_RANTA|nr:unnamed protein product [Rangifer tarandus platyrhynchus]CAI9710470.1 unnamed protein product [Rangifer tarandus platyrhynchus]